MRRQTRSSFHSGEVPLVSVASDYVIEELMKTLLGALGDRATIRVPITPCGRDSSVGDEVSNILDDARSPERALRDVSIVLRSPSPQSRFAMPHPNS